MPTVNVLNTQGSIVGEIELSEEIFGAEINVTDFFDFEAGFMLSGGNPRFSIGSQFDIKGIKMNINYTLDLTTSFNPVNHISLAARLLLGNRGRSKTRAMVYEKYTEGIELYSKGDRQNIQKAIEKWNEYCEVFE